jgi:magnesium transporter
MPDVSFFKIESEGYLARVPAGTLPAARPDEAHDYFVLVQPHSAQDLAAWADASGLGSVVPRDLINPDEDSALFQRRTGSLFMQYPTNWDAAANAKAYLSFLCLPHLIIAVTGRTVSNLDAIIRGATAPDGLRGSHTGALLAYLMSSYAKTNVVGLRELRNDVAEAESALAASTVLANRSTSAEASLRALSRQIAAMLDIVDDQAFVVRTLRELHTPVLNLDEERDFLEDLSADSDYAFRVANRIEARFRLLGARVEQVQADNTDRRLRLLTIISAVFLPLTLVTGYFGMNFVNMPLLAVPHATLFLIASMGALTAGLLVYFKRHDWF